MAESGLQMDANNCDVDDGNSNNHCTKEKQLLDSKDTTDNHVSEENQNYKTGTSNLSSKNPGLKIDLEENNTEDLELSLSSLKKDDSGVDFEKSPASMSAQEGTILSDCSESISESLTDSAACSCTNSVSDTKFEEKSKANISDDDQDDFPSLDIQDNKLDDKEDSNNLQRTAEKMDLDTQGVDDSNSNSKSDSVEKRKPRRELIESSNSDSDIEDKDDDDDDDDDEEEDLDADDDDNDDDEVGSKKLSSDSEEETEMDYDSSKMPKHTWKAISDLYSREYGHSTKTPASLFREKVTSSLQMVQRFCLQYKMEYHDGCVNALNFNRIGELIFILLFFFSFK